jgi:tetratricopeptide (TPR) repeat protein
MRLRVAIVATATILALSSFLAEGRAAEEIISVPADAACLELNRNLPDVVIVACTAALESRGLKPQQRPHVLVSRGRAYAKKGEHALAIADYDEALARDPDLAPALAHRAVAQAKRGRLDQASTDIGRVYELVLHPKTILGTALPVEGLLEFGEAMRDEGDYERAFEAFDFIITHGPKRTEYELGLPDWTKVWALTQRGMTHAMQGKHKRAIADYDQALAEAPKHVEALNGRCFSRAILGALEEASADCNKALDLEPNDPPTLDSRGLISLKQHNFDAALADYEAAVAALPDYASAHWGRGLAKMHKGDTLGAWSDFNAAEGLDSGVAEYYETLGLDHSVLSYWKLGAISSNSLCEKGAKSAC